MNEATAYTSPENRGTCGFCGKEEGGYAKPDADGKMRAACWACVRPEPQPPQKRQPVGITVYEDLDTDKVLKTKTKNPGIPPSTHRPKVS